MARPAVTIETLQRDAGHPTRRHRLHVEVGRVAILHDAGNGAGELMQRLQGARFERLAIAVSRMMLDELLDCAPDVVVVDHDRGWFDIVRVCRDVRESLASPVIVVSGDGGFADEATHIAILDAGAHELLPRSVSAALLLAHIRAAARDKPGLAPRNSRITVGDVVVDLDAHVLYIDGHATRCPPLQFLLLVALAGEANRAVDRDALLATVWGAEPNTLDPRRLRIAVSALRSILGTGPLRPRIETVSHIGYRLTVGLNGAASSDAT